MLRHVSQAERSEQHSSPLDAEIDRVVRDEPKTFFILSTRDLTFLFSR